MINENNSTVNDGEQLNVKYDQSYESVLTTKQNSRSNGSRFVYVMTEQSSIKDSIGKHKVCLPNGFILEKRPKSDELLRYTERDIRSIIRTIIFIHVFPELTPRESLEDLVFEGRSYSFAENNNTYNINDISLEQMVRILDTLLGTGFCRIARHSVTEMYHEYMNDWRYYRFGRHVYAPSTRDYVRLARFVNAATCRYSKMSEFVNRNADDNKIPFQTRHIDLDKLRTQS